jgi:L-2-hydroxyglutarate oxidase
LGVGAAARPDGKMVDDFVIDETDGVENAPSPAATASLNIGTLVVDRLARRFARSAEG